MPDDLAPSLTQARLQVVAGVGAALATLAVDPAGRLLLWPTAALLTGLGLRDALLRPALSLDSEGLVVVHGLRRRTVPWAELQLARVVTDRRAPLLELDLGDTVVVLSRRRLGVPPYQALELLEQHRLTP